MRKAKSFIECKPQLSLRKGDCTAFVIMDTMRKEKELDNYFITLKSVLVGNDLLDKPEYIYNVDEFGVPLEHHFPLMIAQTRQLM